MAARFHGIIIDGTEVRLVFERLDRTLLTQWRTIMKNGKVTIQHICWVIEELCNCMS